MITARVNPAPAPSWFRHSEKSQWAREDIGLGTEAYTCGFLLTQVVLDPLPENQSGTIFTFV